MVLARPSDIVTVLLYESEKLSPNTKFCVISLIKTTNSVVCTVLPHSREKLWRPPEGMYPSSLSPAANDSSRSRIHGGRMPQRGPAVAGVIGLRWSDGPFALISYLAKEHPQGLLSARSQRQFPDIPGCSLRVYIALFIIFFPDFADDHGRCRKSAEKGGWWDGWPPKSRAKCLIIKVFCHSHCTQAPNRALQIIGCHRTLLDFSFKL